MAGLYNIIFWPLAGALLLGASALSDRKDESPVTPWAALLVALLELLVVLALISAGGLQMDVIDTTLADQFRVLATHAGVESLLLFNPVFRFDGLSVMMALLTAVLTVCAILCSMTAVKKGRAGFYACLLLLEAAVMGTFFAGDLLLFYLFWEMMLIPLYFLIGVWGSENRVYATIKFVLFTLTGSVLMLIGLIVLYLQAPVDARTFDVETILIMMSDGRITLSASMECWLFLSLFLAFAIKVPLWPLHTWLPDAHTEAPTAGSVILAGVLLKTGAYGILRFCIPLFPSASVQFAPMVMALSVVAIIYGALTAMAQKDMKRLVAYSSVSHMGFVMLGVFAAVAIGSRAGSRYAATGAMLQMVSHGVSTGALFMLVGVIYERRHTRLMSEFGGLAKVMPRFSVFLVIFVLSSAGLPGLNGFIGEFLILLSAFKVAWYWGALAATGVVLGAVYLLIMVQRVIFGPLTNEANRSLPDMNAREVIMFLPLLLLAFWIGLYPRPFMAPLEQSAKSVYSSIHGDMSSKRRDDFAAIRFIDGHGEERLTSVHRDWRGRP